MPELFDIVIDQDTGAKYVVTEIHRPGGHVTQHLHEWLGKNCLVIIGQAAMTLTEALGLPLDLDWVDDDGVSRAEWAYRLWYAATQDDWGKIDAIMKGDV